MQFKQLISVLCLCVMVALSGCTPYMVIHDLGDDSIQEYIKPAKGLEGGFVDRVKCPTKTMRYSEKYKMKICRGTAGDDAYLAWQVAVDEKQESYAAKAVSAAMHGMSFIPAAAVLGLTMPTPTTNVTQNVQANPYAGSAISTQYINGQVPAWLTGK